MKRRIPIGRSKESNVRVRGSHGRWARRSMRPARDVARGNLRRPSPLLQRHPKMPFRIRRFDGLCRADK